MAELLTSEEEAGCIYPKRHFDSVLTLLHDLFQVLRQAIMVAWVVGPTVLRANLERDGNVATPETLHGASSDQSKDCSTGLAFSMFFVQAASLRQHLFLQQLLYKLIHCCLS